MRKILYTMMFGLTLAAMPLAAAPDRVLTRTFPASEIEALRFEISVAEVVVTAGSGGIKIEIEAECRHSGRECEDALEDLELTDRKRGDVLIVELDGFPKWGKGKLEIEATLTIPKRMDFDIDMGVGELEIDGLEGELDVEVGVGKVEIATASDHLRSINVDVGVGEAEIVGTDVRVEGRRSFLVGSEAYWAGGGGKKRIRVDLGVGEVAVRID